MVFLRRVDYYIEAISFQIIDSDTNILSLALSSLFLFLYFSSFSDLFFVFVFFLNCDIFFQ
jgi:hypothetical protein